MALPGGQGDTMLLLPSSPPVLADLDAPDTDIPSSPLPDAANYPTGLPNRKRQLSEYDCSLSSDPLFSDDPSEAEGITDYDQPRRKRMVRGPWWNVGTHLHGEGSSGRSAVVAGGNYDSGIFMGSDMTEDSSEDFVCGQGSTQDVRMDGGLSQSSGESIMAGRGSALAQHIIHTCLETGKEAVDLSSLSLGHVTSEMLRPLHQLVRQTHTHLTEPPSENEFTVLTPDIKLFLAGNGLRDLPEELFFLGNTTVLSLRNNELTELPPAISRLRRLQELNIAGNYLKFLPWELFSYFTRSDNPRQINVRPNPLVEPTAIVGRSQRPYHRIPSCTDFGGPNPSGDAKSLLDNLRQQCLGETPLDARTELELRLYLGRLLRALHSESSSETSRYAGGYEELIYLAPSIIHYFEMDGKPCNKSQSRDSFEISLQHDNVPSAADSSCAPSLFELAVRSVQSNYQLDEIPDRLPVAVKAALQKAANSVRLGNQKCATCGRPFVIARAVWIEFWFVGSPLQAELTQEAILPFMKRACSWRCATPTSVGESRC